MKLTSRALAEGRDRMKDFLSKAWRSFRGWPTWVQLVVALVVVAAIGGALAGEKATESTADSPKPAAQEEPVEKSEPDSAEESEPEEESGGRCVTAESGNEFCDETAEGRFDSATAYEISRASCGVFSVKQVAREYNTAADPVSAAEGFAEGYRGRSHQAAFEGCLDGFGGEK